MILAFDRNNPRIMPRWAIDARRHGIAFDRASVRNYDSDGRLRISVTNISKANICPYLGSEIPGADKLGLDPNKIYKLLRDPEELRKGAKTFDGVPVLSEHVPVTALDHKPALVMGTAGTESGFADPYLQNSMIIWDQGAIDDINSGKKRELSCAYRYDPDMTPGVYKGEPYDGRMINIVGNHIALVPEGRAGSDVMVNDAMPSRMGRTNSSKEGFKAMTDKTATILGSRKALMAQGALLAFLAPKLAKDAKLDLGPTLAGLTAANFAKRKVIVAAKVKKAIKGKLAADASMTGLAELLDMVEAHPDAIDNDPLPQKTVDDGGEVPAFLKDKLSEDDLATVMDMMAKKTAGDNDPKLNELGAADEDDEESDEDDDKAANDEDEDVDGAADNPPPFKGQPKPGGAKDSEKMVSKKAMDSAITSAVNAAVTQVRKTEQGIQDAKSFVRPWVGEIKIACDSADQVFHHTLKALKVDVGPDVSGSALRTILSLVPKPGDAARNNPRPRSDAGAMDAAAHKTLESMIPGIGNVKII